LAWDRLQIGIVGPWDLAWGLDAILDSFSTIPSVPRAAKPELEVSWSPLQRPEAGDADTPGSRHAFIVALPSVSCEDSRYAALAVANALLAERLRTRLQLRDPQVLYARSLLDRTFVPGLCYVYGTTVSPELTSVVQRVHELVDSIVADGPSID